MWACGSDDDGGPDGSGGASAGAAGHTGGSAGKAQGGGAGKAQGGSAGKAQGGSGNAGSGNAGEGGMPENAGAGGDSAGGDSSGGMGGDSSGAGAGGEAGGANPPTPTVAESCATICAAEAGLNCALASITCIEQCNNLATGTLAPDEYPPMVQCEALHLTASNYECSDQNAGLPPPAPPNPQPAPKAGTQCETLICKWTCADGALVDPNVYARCNCP
jgi:hypothetical protein